MAEKLRAYAGRRGEGLVRFLARSALCKQFLDRIVLSRERFNLSAPRKSLVYEMTVRKTAHRVARISHSTAISSQNAVCRRSKRTQARRAIGLKSLLIGSQTITYFLLIVSTPAQSSRPSHWAHPIMHVGKSTEIVKALLLPQNKMWAYVAAIVRKGDENGVVRYGRRCEADKARIQCEQQSSERLPVWIQAVAVRICDRVLAHEVQQGLKMCTSYTTGSGLYNLLPVLEEAVHIFKMC